MKGQIGALKYEITKGPVYFLNSKCISILSCHLVYLSRSHPLFPLPVFQSEHIHHGGG